MTNKQMVILKALIDLSESDRLEVIKESENVKTKTFSDRGYLNESLEKAQKTLGPLSSANCPCCGR